MRTLRLALAQINATVGDLDGNVERILAGIQRAKDAGADIVSFPELAITGYPPEDLLLKPQFIDDNVAALHSIIPATQGIVAVVGFVDADADIYNAAAVIADGAISGIYHKQYLPNYGVFDENRYFQAGLTSPVFTIRGVRVGVNICEDIWYPTGPIALQCLADAEVIVNINASPFHMGKVTARNHMLAARAMDNIAIVAYTNLAGGQDELIFDGNSVVFDQQGGILAHGKAFAEDILIADVDADAVFRARLRDPRRRQEKLLAHVSESQVPPTVISAEAPPAGRVPEPGSMGDLGLPEHELAWRALVMGLGDYVRKNGFESVVLGLSGGIDSAFCAVLAAEALGPQHVIGVRLPSAYSSEGSLEDARQLADNLGIRLLTLPIDGMVDIVDDKLAHSFADVSGGEPPAPEGVAFENIQSRLRGLSLMALANQFGWLLLTTGNKSEAAVGYTTLYGDSAGAFAPIRDVPKTLVYQLAELVNARGKELIPRASIEKPPSAELRPGQTDQDSLPSYDELDAIIQAYVVEDRDIDDMVALGHDAATVRRIVAMIYASEFKRRQVAPGTKITSRAFGKDRRWPITNRYRS